MPDDTKMGDEPEDQGEGPPDVHDDIMKRLLEYQRQLREGAALDEQAGSIKKERPSLDRAAAESVAMTQTETVEVVDITAAEAEIEANAEVGAPETLDVVEAAEATDVAVEPTTAPELSASDALLKAAESTKPEPTKREEPSEAEEPTEILSSVPRKTAEPEPVLEEVEAAAEAPETRPMPTQIWAEKPVEAPTIPAEPVAAPEQRKSRWKKSKPASGQPAPAIVEQPPSAVSETDARVAELEETLARTSKMITELRDAFQQLAISADERLAVIEESLSVRRNSEDES